MDRGAREHDPARHRPRSRLERLAAHALAVGGLETEIGDERNWVREAMNYALIAIGSRSVSLNQQAAAIAERLGKIEIDYGDTSCQAPDARANLASVRLQSKFAA